MIKFVYRISDNLLPLVRTSIVDYTNDYFIGYMDEGDTANLRHTSLYLACELINTDNISVHSDPIAVVAKNENAAVTMYDEIMSSGNGTVLCVLENRCDNLMVEPIEE